MPRRRADLVQPFGTVSHGSISKAVSNAKAVGFMAAHSLHQLQKQVMPSTIRSDSVSKKVLWAGRVFFAVSVLFLLFDSITHVLKVAPVMDAFSRLGYPVGLALTLGIIEIVCLTAYIVPRTAVLGAILLTGYLGGAVSTNLRVNAGMFPVVFPILLGLLLWGALFLRDSTLRTLIPLRS